jgi:hypothetical protein
MEGRSCRLSPPASRPPPPGTNKARPRILLSVCTCPRGPPRGRDPGDGWTRRARRIKSLVVRRHASPGAASLSRGTFANLPLPADFRVRAYVENVNHGRLRRFKEKVASLSESPFSRCRTRASPVSVYAVCNAATYWAGWGDGRDGGRVGGGVRRGAVRREKKNSRRH